MPKKEFLYWDDDNSSHQISEVEGYLGKAPDKTSVKKAGPKLDGKSVRLYRIFQKLSSREKKKFIKLLEHEL